MSTIQEFRPRVESACDKAIQGFWILVAKDFPEVQGGDADVLEALLFEERARSAVEHWLLMNHPACENLREARRQAMRGVIRPPRTPGSR